MWLAHVYNSGDQGHLRSLLKNKRIKADKAEQEMLIESCFLNVEDPITFTQLRKLMGKLFTSNFADAMFPDRDPEASVYKPFENLFIWSVLMGRDDMAEYFWNSCESPLCLALIACRIFRSTANLLMGDFDKQGAEAFEEKAKYFETLAINLANESYNKNSVSQLAFQPLTKTRLVIQQEKGVFFPLANGSSSNCGTQPPEHLD